MKHPIAMLLCLLLLGSMFAGCSSQEITSVTSETVPPTTVAVPVPDPTTAVSPTEPAATVAPENTGIVSRLREVESEHTLLQDKLMTDGSLNQADMNELTGQQFTLWDNLLNEFWAELTVTLPADQMQQLLQEERAWIRWKESSIAIAADYYGGGSLSIMAANNRAATLTRERVYELAEMLTGEKLTPAQAGTRLYHQVFLTLASWRQWPSYDNVQLLSEFRGLSLKENEGVLQIFDPQVPGEYIFATLSNESGIVTIPQLGYCIEDSAGIRSVRVDIFTESSDYYIDAFFWDDGSLVASLEELTAYLFSN